MPQLDAHQACRSAGKHPIHEKVLIPLDVAHHSGMISPTVPI
ncbi:hypothetical protein [Bradyrhizobium sp. LMG 9283]